MCSSFEQLVSGGKMVRVDRNYFPQQQQIGHRGDSIQIMSLLFIEYPTNGLKERSDS